VPLLHEIVDALRNLVYPKIMGTLRGAGAAAAANREWIVAFNAIDHAAAYASQLRDRVGAAFCGEFESLAQMADPALEEFANISIHLRQQGAELAAALAATLLPTAWLLLEFGPAEYEIGSEAHEAAIQQSFDEKLLAPLDDAIGSVAPSLREANVDLVVGALAELLAAQLEEACRQKSYNELGALLLSEQVRKLSDALSSRSSGSVRHQFGRLTHLAFVLNVGSLQEAAALLMSTMGAAVKGGEAAPPRLSRAEAVRVLGLRVEFNVAELREMMPDLAEEEAEEEAKRAEKELPW